MQPPEYKRNYDFAKDNETNREKINAELDKISESINRIRENLSHIQADDLGLKDWIIEQIANRISGNPSDLTPKTSSNQANGLIVPVVPYLLTIFSGLSNNGDNEVHTNLTKTSAIFSGDISKAIGIKFESGQYFWKSGENVFSCITQVNFISAGEGGVYSGLAYITCSVAADGTVTMNRSYPVVS